jgi:hypothetical protein
MSLLNSRVRVVGKVARSALLSLFSGAVLGMFGGACFAQDKPVDGPGPVSIGTRGDPLIAIPYLEPTNACSEAVFVESLVKNATVKIWLRRKSQPPAVVFDSVVSEYFGQGPARLSEVLETGDVLWAEESLGGITSKTSAKMTVGAMGSNLSAPLIEFPVWQCGQLVTVSGLTPGVWVEVNDRDSQAPGVSGGAGRPVSLGDIGWGSTPDALGGSRDAVFVDPTAFSAATKVGHRIRARQIACTKDKSGQIVKGQYSGESPVQAAPTPPQPPSFDPSVVGANTITANNLYVGALLSIYQGAQPTAANQISSSYANDPTNTNLVSPAITAMPLMGRQTLCEPSPIATAPTPSTNLAPIELVGPVCPKLTSVIVKYATPGATLALSWKGGVISVISASPGDVRLDIPASVSLTAGDNLEVTETLAESSGSPLRVNSNVIVVGCTNVATYHNNSMRTGWNSDEYTLTPAKVGKEFGLLKTVYLGEQDANKPQYDLAPQVDAQPLILTDQPIFGNKINSVVYVETEGNVVYAIDGWTGDILLHRKLGDPWPQPNCGNNAKYIGIGSTPTIDVDAKTMYVMANIVGSDGRASYQLFALDPSTLADKHAPAIVSVTKQYPLADGTTTQFDPNYQRQRSALLEGGGGNIYAGFASYCDNGPLSRGWMFGWSGGGVHQLSGYSLNDSLTPNSRPPETKGWYLSSVWMSGFGAAADAQGNVYFVTGNSDKYRQTYTGTSNIQESVVKMPADLSKVSGLYTPSDWWMLDQGDLDFGAGGITLLPNDVWDHPFAPIPRLAVAAGKDGNLYFLDRDALAEPSFMNMQAASNGFVRGLLQTVQVGDCHCGESYYKGPDGDGRIVSSGGGEVMSWNVRAVLRSSGGAPAAAEAVSALLSSDGWNYNGPQSDGGFFTSISSNSTNANSAVIWAVGHDDKITLYAFDATASNGSLRTLWSDSAGEWGESTGSAHPNIVPTVANGRVYVASGGRVDIFGLTPGLQPQVARIAQVVRVREPIAAIKNAAGPLFWGTLLSDDDGRATLKLRTGEIVQIDATQTRKGGIMPVLVVGRYLAVNGSFDASGVLHADAIWKVGEPASWGVDRRE